MYVFSERNFTSFRDCTETHLEGCVSYFGDVITTALRPYVGLLDTVYQKACTKGKPLNPDTELAMSPIVLVNIQIRGSVNKK